MQIDMKQTAEVAILISDKIDCKTKARKKDKGGHYIILGKNTARRYSPYKHICTQRNSTKIYKENLGGLQERYQQQHTRHRGF